MQIACKRFGCQKAVEVCYWTCKHRKNCKDWKGAIESVPGSSAITERLEMAAAKSGRPFDAKTLVKPVRLKRAVAAAVPSVAMLAPVAPATVKIAAKVTVSKLATPKLTAKSVNRTHRKLQLVKLAKPERKLMPKPEEEKLEAVTENTAPKSSKPALKPIKPKLPTNGTVYLLLGKGGKYRELRESELMKEAATILKDPSLRLVKGQYLVPQITFKPFDE